MKVKQIFIDVETAGLNPVDHGLIQVAGVIVIDGRKMQTFDYLMCPPSLKTFQQRALEVIGRSMDEIETFDKSADKFKIFHKMLCKYVNPFDKVDKFQFIAYNSPFDADFIRQWFTDNDNKYYGSIFWTPDICVMRKAGDYLQDERYKLKNFRLETVCKHLNIDTKGDLHDAMVDVALTMRLYKSLGGSTTENQGELKL